jgi:hypothetical protein
MIVPYEEGLNIGFTIQLDTLYHHIPNFIAKAGRAGVRSVFIGLVNINPENLLGRGSDRTVLPNIARCCRP